MVKYEDIENNREKAISIAKQLALDNQLEIESLEGCEFDQEETPPEWVVRFKTVLPNGVACGGDLVIVLVNPSSWTADFFETL